MTWDCVAWWRHILVGHPLCAYCAFGFGNLKALLTALTLELLTFQLCGWGLCSYHPAARVGPQGAANLSREGLLCWHSLIILRNMPSIASFLHPGGSCATEGKGELELCPKGRNVVIREVENRTEPKESGFDCACLFPDCKQGARWSAWGQKTSPQKQNEARETEQNKRTKHEVWKAGFLLNFISHN